MRLVIASTFLVLLLGASSCTRATQDSQFGASSKVSSAPGRSLGAAQRLETLLIGVADPVIGNMSFVEGLESAALSESEIAHWGPMTGSIMESGGQFWGVLPLSSVVAVVVTVERVHLNEVMKSLVRTVTGP